VNSPFQRIIYSANEPWLIDPESNKILFGISTSLDNTDIFSSHEQEFRVFLITDRRLKMVLLMHYKHSALCLFLASIVIYFIVFLAPRNRALVFCTHLCLCFWLLFYGFEMR